MPSALKDLFSAGLVKQLGNSIALNAREFDVKAFEKKVLDKQWKELELKQRMRKISTTLGECLDIPYQQQLTVLKKSAKEFNGLFGMVFPDFVEVYGQAHPDLSLDALEFFTPFSSSEFAIRPFLLHYPELTLKRMMEWSKSKNYHVRRLASEGSRPRLPWAMAIPALKKDPSPVLPILENLKNDPEDYVYRSVANNLNDISKDHPQLVLTLCKKWKGQSKSADWVVKHALRTLLKKGNQEALQLFGHHDKNNVAIESFSLNKKSYSIGEQMSFRISIKNSDKKKHSFRLEYRMHYVKANGKTSPKTFLIRKTELSGGESLSISKSQWLKDFSTRKHYSGKHSIELIINGVVKSKIDFNLK